MSTTAGDLISKALRLLNVTATNELPDSPESLDALKTLNWMLESMANDRLMLFCDLNETFNLSAGIASYTIGAGGVFNTQRPETIKEAFVRNQSATPYIDIPLEIVNNERYQDLALKTLQSTYPRYLYYNAAYPLGTIYLHPVPLANILIGISQLLHLTKFAYLTTSVSLPLGYEQMLIYNLVLELSPEYGRQVSPVIAQKAVLLKDQIKRMNNKQSLLKADSGLLGASGGHQFNIYEG